MEKFDLASLTYCGAKTRLGGSCKRRGTKVNGRCRLHGGKSTGAKTKTGKLTSSRNAACKIPSWFLGIFTNRDKSLYKEATHSCKTLEALAYDSSVVLPSEINQLVAKHRIALEVMKYAILSNEGVEPFLLIQSALDHYYQDSVAKHLKCHLYFSLVTSPYFRRRYSLGQERYLQEHLERAADKEMRKLHQHIDHDFLYKNYKKEQ